MKLSAIAVLLGLVGYCAASGISPCAVGCAMKSSRPDCSYTSPSCTCNDQTFRNKAHDCMVAQCTAQELADAEAYSREHCGH
ncbi:hypothetical protein GQ42DRAFT_160513 [Ramicandelaber brevisporus]|nr:hypothetical protein GQ42DRAFT_160513 [Ramicandelaber brevisporus]